MSEFLPEIILAAIALINGLAACLAWLAKLRWAKEYRETTNRVIQAKDAQIAAVERELQAHRTLTPKTLREHYDAAVSMFEERIADLQNQVATEKEEAEEALKKIESLQDALLKVRIADTVLATLHSPLYSIGRGFSANYQVTGPVIPFNLPSSVRGPKKD